MQRTRKIVIAKAAVILGAIPFILWAHEYGPDPGYCNVPKENGTCINTGCHVGTLNTSGGSVKVTFPNGTSYTPGTKQHLTVTIADPATSQRAWGFQLTARESGNTTFEAGSFASTDNHTLVMCASTTTLANFKELDFGGAQTCPSAQPLAYIEHSLDGYQSTLNQAGSATYEFDWTPPATDVGSITFYLAGNAGPGGPPNQNNAHIYTNTFTLTPAASTGPTPTVTKVVSASGFGGFSAIAPGTWIEITGTNLNTNTRIWSGTDFSGNNAPTALDGTSVKIGGQSAFIYYISPTQVNALVPSGVSTGSQQLTVTAGTATSAAFNVTVNALEPGLLALPQSPWLAGTKQYVVAQACDAGKTCVQPADLTFILPAGTTLPPYPVRPAKPGEILTIYGVGFGPVVTGSNANIPAGQVVTEANQLVNAVQMSVNGVAATLKYAGLAPSQVGLYQFNVLVPAVPDGDWPLTFSQNGTAGTQTLLLSVHQ